jgi:hypothetical protein
LLKKENKHKEKILTSSNKKETHRETKIKFTVDFSSNNEKFEFRAATG